jgi:hypothetical protein
MANIHPWLLPIINHNKLSDVTKTNYRNVVQRLQSCTGKDLEWIVTNHHQAMEAVSNALKCEPLTIRTYVSILLGLFKYSPDLQGTYHIQYNELLETYRTLSANIAAQYDSMKPGVRSGKSFMPWHQVEMVRDAFPDKTSMDFLVVCCYTLMEPLRADLGCVRIVKHGEPRPNEDHLMVDSHGDSMQLHIGALRKVSKPFNREIPSKLCRIIHKSLLRQPRKYLLVSPSTQKAFTNAVTFSNYVGRVLKRVLHNEHASINMLRHSFVSSLDLNNMPRSEMRQTASNMGNSTGVMLDYRIVNCV